MIQVHGKNYENIPRSIKYGNIKEKIGDLLEKKKEHSFQGYNKRDVKAALLDIYHHKCAYCESKLGKMLEIEHYRPKKDVSDAPRHGGYYWLGYEWSNLVLSCSACHRLEGGKQNQFPLEDEKYRVMSPPVDRAEWKADSDTMRGENPLLLHPLTDNPEDHLDIGPDGFFKRDRCSVKGRKTIDVCNLDREPLALDVRKHAVDTIFRRIKDRCLGFLICLEGTQNSLNDLDKDLVIQLLSESLREPFQEIKRNCGEESEYSLTFKCLHDSFNDFVDACGPLKELPEELKAMIKRSFALFKDNKI